MVALLPYPHIDPVIVRLGPFAVRWYGLAYVAAFAVAWFVLRSLDRRWELGLSEDDRLETLLAAVIGVVVGARLGYVFFYNLSFYLSEPLRIFAVWDGGMSFHGGLAGILVAAWVMSRRVPVSFLRLCDVGSVAAPAGFFFGRLANFVNGELWGRPSRVPWAMVFPGAGPVPRHPSQLYEALFEGVVLFAVMWRMSRRRRPEGELLGWLLILYGAFRFMLEFFREPDPQVGLVLGPFTMGQLLSVPMILAGAALLVWVYRRRRSREGGEEHEPDEPRDEDRPGSG